MWGEMLMLVSYHYNFCINDFDCFLTLTGSLAHCCPSLADLLWVCSGLQRLNLRPPSARSLPVSEDPDSHSPRSSSSPSSPLWLLWRSGWSSSPGPCRRLSAAHTLARAHREPITSLQGKLPAGPSRLSAAFRDRMTSRNWTVSPW